MQLFWNFRRISEQWCVSKRATCVPSYQHEDVDCHAENGHGLTPEQPYQQQQQLNMQAELNDFSLI